MNLSSPLTFAAIADVHGNRWALDAVLADIDRRGVTRIVNLGDCLTGPLDPATTADLLMSRNMPGVCGNDDRALFAPTAELSPSQIFTCERLTPAHLNRHADTLQCARWSGVHRVFAEGTFPGSPASWRGPRHTVGFRCKWQ